MPKNAQTQKAPANKITLSILEDNPTMVAGMKMELDKPNIIICSISNNVKDFLKELKRHKPAIAIIDLGINGDEGFEKHAGFTAITAGKEISPSTKFIIYTYHDELQEFENGMNLGIKAFITKNIYEKPLDKIVKIIFEGGTYFGALLEQYLNKLNEKPLPPRFKDGNTSINDLLTNRELEVLDHLSNNLTIKEIAKSMQVELNTIKAHTQSIRKKLNVKTTKEAVRVYIISKSSNSQ